MRQGRLYTAARPDGSRRGADVSSNCHIPTHGERPHGVLAIQHNNEVRDVGSNLKAPSKTARCDARRRRPRPVGKPSDDDARSCFSRENKAGFDDLEDSKS